VPHVPTKKSVEQLCREFQGLQDLLFLLSPERRKRLKPMIDEVRRQIEDADVEKLRITPITSCVTGKHPKQQHGRRTDQ
jgi:hypothetical protein